MWIRTLNGIEFIPMTLTIQGLPITKTNNMAQQTAVNFLYEFVQLKLTHKQQMQFEGLF